MTTSALAAPLEAGFERQSLLSAVLQRRLWTGVVLAIAFSCAITAAGAFSTRVPLVYRSTSTHVALDTASGSIALLAAFVLFGRFRWTGRLPDLLSALSLGVLGVTNVAFAVTSAGAADEGSPIRVWTPLVWRFVGALLLGLASVSPDWVLRGKRRAATTIGGGIALLLFGATLATQLADKKLPLPNVPPAHRLTPFHPLSISIFQLVSAAVIIGAAVAFGRGGVRKNDELYRWLSAGCVVFAFARLNYAIFPSLYSSWIYTGDVLRLGFYAIVVLGAVREISRIQRRVAEQEGVIEERRRLARDLHDDLAQDLAYIALEARLALASVDSPRLEQLALAAERALERSRGAITALAPSNAVLSEAVVRAAEEVAARGDIRLYVDVPPDVDAPAHVREALVQIAREAVANAARHARAQHVWVVLATGRSLRLTIADDGKGFVVGAARPRRGGFGLTSMRERAERIGANFRIESGDFGTTVEVIVR
jgi:signal transduction histidine kinase